MISTRKSKGASENTLRAPSAIIVAQGRVLDFIDGSTQRHETPEEYVRQEIAKSLVREYEYAKRDISVEFKIKLGSTSKRADLVVFPADAEHTQENAWLIVECKKQDIKPADRTDRKSTRLNSSHSTLSRMPSSA